MQGLESSDAIEHKFDRIGHAGKRLLSIIVACVMVGAAFLVAAPFASAAPGATFVPPHSDYGVDTNSNGLYDELAVDAIIQASEDGWYWVRGDLYDGSSSLIESDGLFTVYLLTGLNTVQLTFSWQSIYGHGVDGPYTVEMIVNDNGGSLLDSDTHITGVYSVSDFEYASFSPLHSDYGDDIDSNGLYDNLVVDVIVDASRDGWFWVYGDLYDSLDNLIESVSSNVFLLVDFNTVTLTFSGIFIYSNGLDGPFTLDLTLRDDSGIWLSSDTYVSTPYLYSEFEHAVLAPPYTDYGVDDDANGYYEWLVVEVYVDVSSDGWYWGYASLYDGFDNEIESNSEHLHLLTGMNTIPVGFRGTYISSNGEDGPYEVRLVLNHDSGRQLDSDTYTTDMYYASDFEYAVFSPPHTDYGEDSNGNVLYDQLLVEAVVEVTLDGWYHVYGTLYDSLSYAIYSSSDYVHLTPGVSFVTLAFPGLDIFLNGIDGPYYVDLELIDDTGRWLASDLHVTTSYSYTDFEQPGVQFTPPYSDYGVDSDSNGYYDELDIDVSATCTVEGWYQVHATLFDSYDGFIDAQGWFSVYFMPGVSSGTLQFSWQSIYTHGVDGPYYVVLELQDDYSRPMDSDLYWTGSYTVSDFEYAVFTPPHSDHGNDTNSNGMYDELVVEASVEVSMDAWYYLEAILRDSSSTWIGYAMVFVHLNSGANTIPFAFDGTVIRTNGVDGPYAVFMSLQDDSHIGLDSGSHATSAYAYTDFEYIPPGAVFSPPHSDHGNDTNSNGLFEQLNIDASLAVASSGWYHLTADLYDKFRQTIEFISTDVYLETGSQTVTLEFYGPLIYHNGVEGPYHVDLTIYDSNSTLCDADAYVTGSYSIGDFEYAVFSPPHSDYGDDTDSNGYYDQLVIDAVVSVSSDGWYRVSCNLYDNLSGFIDSDAVRVALTAGSNDVQLLFPWQSIFHHGVDGPYVAEMILNDDMSKWVDSDIYVTLPYLTMEFEYAMFSPPHSDYGLDTDSNGLYEALVVEVVVDVSSTGWYWGSGALYDDASGLIETQGPVQFYLTAGTNMVPVLFSWESICNHGVDGPYTLDMTLWDDDLSALDSDIYVTDEYAVSDFESAVFSPPHSEHAVDSNSNGLYDELVVDASVSVTIEQWYHVDASLFDGLSHLIDQSSVDTYLMVGTNTVALSFSGIEIYNDGVDGPYYVEMDLSDPVSHLDSDSYTTLAYLYTEFDQPSHFEAPHSDHGLDTNGNTLYDELVIDVSINASYEGWFYVYGDLYDGLSGWIDSDGWDHVYLMAGLNTIQLSYSWKSIFSHGMNGPYAVELTLQDDSWTMLDSDTDVTDAYDLGEFDHAMYFPPHSDYGDDTNGNSLYDNLIVDAVIDVSVEDWYWVHAELTDGMGTWIDADGWYNVYLTTGPNNIEFSFNGIDIFENGVDGPYTVAMQLYDYWPYGHLLSSDTYTTNSYLYTEFEQLPHFVPPHFDYGEDTNSNGQYDNLVVEVEVSVTIDDWYWVYGTLYDSNSTWIEDLAANVYLVAGMNTVTLRFSGIDIFINAVDGPYVVDLQLSGSVWYDSDVYATSSYLYTEFEHFGAVFSPPHSDRAEDWDSNGLYDHLVIDVEVNVLSDDWYYVDCSLTDNSSIQIDGISNYMFLSTGMNMVEFTFSWERIFCHGVDGPYNANLQVSIWDNGWRILDTDTHMTLPYVISDFEYAVFSPPHTDYGTDTNGNGLFDELDVDVAVSVSVEGWYQVYGELYDNASHQIDARSVMAYLMVGLNTVNLPFVGTGIYSNGVDGPYSVELDLYDPGGPPTYHFDSDTHMTAPYLASDFEGAILSPPHSDFAVDLDSNGFYDQLEVDVSVTVSSDGSYWVSGTLYDNTSAIIESVSVSANLLAGTNTVALNFTGMYIYSNGVDGPFIVELRLYDNSWRIMDTGLHVTAAYMFADFDHAMLSPPHSDYGVDTNSNGLYDELAVDVSIDVTSEGWYYVSATLLDGTSNWIGSASATVYLFAGTSTVQLSFAWESICSHGVDGPYEVSLTLMDSAASNTLDTDSHTTAAYTLSEFESAVFAPPHTDYGDDSDTNGLYERLVVDLNIDVTSDGWYWVFAALYDDYNSMIDGNSVHAYLLSGTNTVEMSFIWQSIFYHGVDGRFVVYLDLQDERGYWVDSETYLTNTYLVSDFEYAMFSPPHSDYAEDTDANGLYDQLVVDASVSVSIDGWYRVTGRLYDGMSGEIQTITERVYLTAGANTVSLTFLGVFIVGNGVDGPYVVNLLLDYDDGRPLDADSYLTNDYYANEFEPVILAPPHYDYPTDTNGDGYFDELAVVVNVGVAVAGTYTVDGTLYDMSMNLIASNSTTMVLGTSFQTMTLVFSGFAISEGGSSGPFVVELTLRDSVGTIMDTGTHITAGYDWTSFARGFTLHLQPGWNLVAIPLVNFVYSASTLGLMVGDEVASWDPLTQTYDQDYIVGVSPGTADFVIEGGVGYWIYAYVNEDIELIGGAPSSMMWTMINAPAGGGWVVVGLTSLNSTLLASDLAAMFSGGLITDLARWNSTTGTYDAYIVGIDPSTYDFALSPGEAYWIWVTASGMLLYGP
jgi:hypothetical protein